MVHIVGLGGTLRANSRSAIALEYALQAAGAEGASTEMFSLYDLDLPMFRPNTSLADYGQNVQKLIASVQKADGVLISTGAYHGTLAGATKNALDFFEFLHDDNNPYLHNRAVGLIAVSGGQMAAVHTISTLINTVHSLRGLVVPLTVPIGQGSKAFVDGKIVDGQARKRLTMLAQETVRIATRMNPETVAV